MAADDENSKDVPKVQNHSILNRDEKLRIGRQNRGERPSHDHRDSDPRGISRFAEDVLALQRVRLC